MGGDGDDAADWLPRAPVLPHAPYPPYDPPERLPSAQPRDEPRWPTGRYPAEYGPYGYGQYGGGGYGPDGVWYPPGDLAGGMGRYGYDFPTSQIMRRPSDPVGPWERAGVLVNADGTSVLPLFVRQRGRDSFNKYNYRTLVGANNDIPVEFGSTRSDWLSNGDATAVTGLTGSYTVQLYEEYR